MCHSFIPLASLERYKEIYNIASIDVREIPAAVNVGYPAPVVLSEPAFENHNRLMLMEYGFPGDGYFYNARYETVTSVAKWADSYRSRRCLIPVKSFFEGRPSSPKEFALAESARAEPLALAAIHNREHTAFCILTCDAYGIVKEHQGRAPVIMPLERSRAWLDNSQAYPVLDVSSLVVSAPELQLLEPVT